MLCLLTEVFYVILIKRHLLLVEPASFALPYLKLKCDKRFASYSCQAKVLWNRKKQLLLIDEVGA